MTEPSLRSGLAALLLVVAPVVAADAGPGEPLTELEFDDPQRQVGFLAVDLDTGQQWAVAPDTLDARRPPFSTFKIPNLLIALDTGVAASLEQGFEWDPERRPAGEHWPEAWAQDQTLATAFRRSVVWVFRDLALMIGGPVYRDRLAAFGYGNAAAPDGSDLFWLDGTLSISLREQTDFLAALLRDELPVSKSAVDALAEVARLDQHNGLALYGKTGAGPLDGDDFDGAFRGWLVGWVERPDRAPVVYALFVDGPNWDAIASFRREASVSLLRQAGVWAER
jgi:beta-lactamase class D